MKLYTLNAENWRMDGGAGFGLVPKTIWSKSYAADDLNNIGMKSRCLLIQDENRLILVDTGMGRKRGDKYYQFKYISGDESLEKYLKMYNFEFEDITDVILTHLHDDHVGGAVKKDENSEHLKLTFPNATHWVSRGQWEWAVNPNKREAGTYFKDNFLPIQEAGKIKFIEKEGMYLPNIFFKLVSGHTKEMIIPMIHFNDKILCYMADFIPTTAHIPIPYIAAVDIVPLLALQEKEDFLNESAEKNYYWYFEHDYFTEICNVKQSEKGIILNQKLTLDEFITNE